MIFAGPKSLRSFALCATLLLAPTMTARSLSGRNDLEDVPPIWDTGYVVPLQGGETCSTPNQCTNSLPAPSSDKILKKLTLARGVLNYTCANIDATDSPIYVSENVELWDAAPLLPFIPNEATFHSLVPQFYSFDYSSLNNSTLTCIGSIYTEYGSTISSLNNIDVFPIEVEVAIKPSDSPAFNADWVKSNSLDGTWDIYRVETYQGAIPPTCGEHNGTLELGFAAEYWFYQTQS